MIRYIEGDATQPIGTGSKVLCHICNDRGGWGKGFVLAVSRRWPEPEQYYRRWCAMMRAAEQSVLGEVQFVEVAKSLTVANMVAQHGYRTTQSGPPIRYDALRACLRRVRLFVRTHNATLHMPRIGTGLAGATWDKIEPLIQTELSGIDVTVYNLKGR